MHDEFDDDDDDFDDDEDENDLDDEEEDPTGFYEKLEWGPNKKPAFRLNYPPGEPNVTAFSKLFMELRLSSKIPMPPLGDGASAGLAHIKFPGEGNEIIEMIHDVAGITVAFETVESRDYVLLRIKNDDLFIGGPNYE